MKKKYLFLFAAVTFVIALCLLWGSVSSLNNQIVSRFEGRRWELPARIYGRSLDLYVGRDLQIDQLQRELDLLSYRQVRLKNPENPGEYFRKNHGITIHSRNFSFADGEQLSALITCQFAGGSIVSLTDKQSGGPRSLFRLEPLHIASIYPGDNEDRLLVRIKDTPRLLVQVLLLTEDRKFYHHIGVRPFAICRALLANLKAGKTVQGGSTLTQQLVKNLFLTNKKSLSRKINGAVMALLLEYHYEKNEILETYLNEIYLGQDGKRAIHGFAMASKFYFGRNIDELSPDQTALLVGLAKGASFYDPRKHPARARARRNHILENMGATGMLSPEVARQLQEKPLGVLEHKPSGITRYPAFVKLVRRQLKRDYKDEDLRNEGLSIFTTFDPFVQAEAEKSLRGVLADIERERHIDKETLQGALVICSSEQGEVLAVVGDRFAHQDGFNRVLDMKRPAGSIIKPAVYLNALARPEQYNLLTLLDDSPLLLENNNGETWQPQNYDKQSHGDIPLIQALVHSYNVATVRLGMELGLDNVIETLHRLGISRGISPYPSLLLGAVDLSPVEILQMYQTIAAGGYKTPLRAILAVTDRQNKLLQQYPLTVDQAASPSAIFCLSAALQEVSRSGTAASLQQLLPAGLVVAGKTGTTNNLRDSWFAGFSGSHVAVAWVGRDDNGPTGLTGSSGALRVWADFMSAISTKSLDLKPPEDIDFYFADSVEGSILADNCQQGQLLPFVRDGVLPPVSSCGISAFLPSENTNRHLNQKVKRTIKTFMRIFQ